MQQCIPRAGDFPRRDAAHHDRPGAFIRRYASGKRDGCRGPGGGGTLPARSGSFAAKQETALPCI